MSISRVDAVVGTTLLLLAALSASHPVKAQSPERDVIVQYEIPEFGMKLIILDEEEVSTVEFQHALDIVVSKHMDEYLERALPPAGDGTLVNQESFSNVVLQSKAVHTPVDPDDSEGVKLSVVRAGFEGVGNFHYSPELAQAASLQPNVVVDAVYLLKYVKDAFREDGGFWDLAADMADDNVLSRTGKLQVAVGNLIVGEGSLVGEDDDDGQSKLKTVLISVFVPIGVILLVVAVFVLRRKLKNCKLERQKRERRERARKRRIYERSSIGGSARSLSVSSSDGDGKWMDQKAKQVSSIPGRLSGPPAKPLPKRNLRARPAQLARQKSNESLLHCIVEEDTGHEETTRRSGSDEDYKQDIENVFGASSQAGSDDDFQSFEGFQSCDLLEFNETNSNNGSRTSILSGAADSEQSPSAYNIYHDSYFQSSQGASNSSYHQESESESYSGRSHGASNKSHQQESYSSNNQIRDKIVNHRSSIQKEDVFGLMNQEGFDTLNPDEFDFDHMSAANYSVDDGLSISMNGSIDFDEGMDLGTSMNFDDYEQQQQSIEIDYATDDEEDGYEPRIDPNLEFA